jgi:urea transporter
VADSQTNRDESEKERLDRNLLELLNELRVALPGVQVLFAFLLTVPFTQRFTTLTATQEKVYYTTLLLTTASSVLLIAPTAHHRINFRRKDKAYIVLLANKLAIAGLVFLALAMSGVVYLITDLLYSSTATAVATAGALIAFGLLWYAVPLWRRMRRGVDAPDTLT